MTSRRPSQTDEYDPSGDPFNSEQTVVENGEPGSPLEALAPKVFVLERGIDSQGSAPLSLVSGQPQGPVSIGRAGQFRVDGRGVLATHAYLMFDGEGVYLCSADAANPLVVDGARIPADWTRVGVPSTLLLGRARALLRGAAAVAPPRPRPPKHDDGEEPTDPGPGLAPAAFPDAFNSFHPAPAAQAPPAPRPNERPRVVAHSDDESTRVEANLKPLVLRPSAGDDESTRLNAEVLRGPARSPSEPPADDARGNGPGHDERSGSPTLRASGASAGFPVASALGPATIVPNPRSLEPTVVRSLTPLKRLQVWFRLASAPGSPKRTPLLVIACATVAIVVVCFVTFVRALATNRSNAAADAANAQAAAPTPLPAAPPVPEAPTALPGVVVYPAPPRPPPEASTDPPVPTPRNAKPPPPPPATLERNAVDAINRGDLNAALALYRQLSLQQPDNPAFANATRILQQRVAATP